MVGVDVSNLNLPQFQCILNPSSQIAVLKHNKRHGFHRTANTALTPYGRRASRYAKLLPTLANAIGIRVRIGPIGACLILVIVS